MKAENIFGMGFPHPPLEKGSGAVYFSFEEDFIEENIRCIPMIVRFKLDACGIKLKLNEWSKMTVEERKKLTEFVCATHEDIQQYRVYLQQLILKRTGNKATDLPIESNPEWAIGNEIPRLVKEQLTKFDCYASIVQWKALSNLQRFVLMKLSRPGHENRNFPKAIKEFGLYK